jgi:uncharacterized protein (UPF0333 family)
VSGIVKEFLTLSLGIITLYVILTHYTGAEKTISATGNATANIFKTLQGTPQHGASA